MIDLDLNMKSDDFWNKIIDAGMIQRYIGKVFSKIMKQRNLTVSVLATKLWVSQPYISRVLLWHDRTLMKSKIYEIWWAIWIKEDEVFAIVQDAKRVEFYSHYPFKDIESPWLQIRQLLVKYWIIDEKDVEEIMNFIDFVKKRW